KGSQHIIVEERQRRTERRVHAEPLSIFLNLITISFRLIDSQQRSILPLTVWQRTPQRARQAPRPHYRQADRWTLEMQHSRNEGRQGEAGWLRRHFRNTTYAVTPMIAQGRWPVWPPASGSNGTGAAPKGYLRTCPRKSARTSAGQQEIRRKTG